MLKAILSFVLVVAFSVASFAQGSPPSSGGVSHFSVTASALGTQGAGSATAAAIAGGSVNLTKRVALCYQQIQMPSYNASFYLGEGCYTLPITSLFGKKISSHFTFNTANWSVTFFGGAGILRQTAVSGTTTTQAQHIAETAGMGLNYTANNHITIQVVSGQWLHGGLQGMPPNQFVTVPDLASVSTGLRITF